MAKRESALARVAARRYWREDDARLMIEAWQESGLPLVAFAERHDVQTRRLVRWAERVQSMGPKPVSFHRVRLVESGGCGASSDERIEVILAEGCTVRVPPGFVPEDLRKVLNVLKGRV